MTSAPPFPFLTITTLGIATIAAYGTWAYAFGVLLLPILDDTGWSESWVAGSFALSSAGGGFAAPWGGAFLDRFGVRVVFITAAVVSVASFFLASTADSLPLFMLPSVIGGSTLAALCFYHVTQSAAVRAAPESPTRAISWLTIIGAFSSPIYLPLAAALVERTDWRATLRVLSLTTGLILLIAAIIVRERERPVATGRRRLGLQAMWDRPEVRTYAIATACIGSAVGIILVYQVPLMTAAGLPLTTAAWMAGARGFAQVGGRLPLTWMVRRFTAKGSLRIAFAAITLGIMLLAVSGSIVVAALYAAVAGFGIGATSPLQGLYANELFARETLGASMGTMSMIFGVSGAIGPAVVGVLSDLTGTRLWGIGIAVALAVLATTTIASPAAGPGEEC